MPRYRSPPVRLSSFSSRSPNTIQVGDENAALTLEQADNGTAAFFVQYRMVGHVAQGVVLSIRLRFYPGACHLSMVACRSPRTESRNLPSFCLTG